MLRRRALIPILLLPSLSTAQFASPKREYHVAEPGLYTEDPFIVKYRREFFSVFRGEFGRFEKAFQEIQDMAKKDPKDARARVWLGNGLTVKAGLLAQQGKPEESLALLERSRAELDAAVAMKPGDPNIYMMRAATLFIQGQHWPSEKLPRSVWERLREDCTKFIAFMGDRLPRASIHVRGEVYGELGIAELRLGNKAAAAAAFRRVVELCRGTSYEERARKELEALAGTGK